MTEQEVWFKDKVRDLGELLRALPNARQATLWDELQDEADTGGDGSRTPEPPSGTPLCEPL